MLCLSFICPSLLLQFFYSPCIMLKIIFQFCFVADSKMYTFYGARSCSNVEDTLKDFLYAMCVIYGFAAIACLFSGTLSLLSLCTHRRHTTKQVIEAQSLHCWGSRVRISTRIHFRKDSFFFLFDVFIYLPVLGSGGGREDIQNGATRPHHTLKIISITKNT